MDDVTFDRLIRQCAIPRSRRRIFREVAGAMAIGHGARIAGSASAGCDPSCDGRVCGSDGCGGVCGECQLGEICNPVIGICEVDPPPCSNRGELCHFEQPCCAGLVCDDGTCVDDDCQPLDSPCDELHPCCPNRVCLNGVCEASPGVCVQTGEPCASTECCDLDDTCSADPPGTLICQTAAPIDGDCVRAGEKVGAGGTCCPRLHRERGRCVVNRWDACTKNKGRQRTCERGTRCLDGKHSPSGNQVCVPVRRGRKRWTVLPWGIPVESGHVTPF